MDRREALKNVVYETFAAVPPPLRGDIVSLAQGEEAMGVADDFREVPPWTSLTADFLDSSPEGQGTALAWFSPRAFRFYLPAFLIADLSGRLTVADPTHSLMFGLSAKDEAGAVTPTSQNEVTRWEAARWKMSRFSIAEARVVVSYLESTLVLEQDADRARGIIAALERYWILRAHGVRP